MKYARWIPAALPAALVIMAAAAPLTAGEEEMAQAEAQAGAPDMEQMMAEYMEKYGTPGPEHEHFKRMVGKWRVTSRMWMEPGAPPTTSTGSSEMRLIMDGRFLLQKFQGDFMGKPFEGLGIEGFDRFRGQYLSTWMDSMGTGIFMMRGACDPEAKRCTYFGRMDDAMTGEVGKMVKSVGRWVDKDTSVFEMYDLQGGPDWVRVFEMTYKRVK